jgi:LacI family transcriptional regulator
LKNSTINDVSKESNVSITTVSRVLNGLSKKYRISEETEELVIKAAEKLNYRPNLAAVNFRLKKTNIIGLLVPSLANPFFANMSSFITTELHKKGYSVMVCDCGEDQRIEAEMVNQLADRRIDGLLVSPSGSSCLHFENVYKLGLPVVCFDRYFENSVIPFVSSHNFQGAYEITKYLINAGHKRLACIQGTSNVMPMAKRTKGFLDAVNESGLHADVVGNGFTVENGYIETKLLLNKAEPPTAIFTFTNPIALGAIKALREEGLNIPRDISLVTFDDAEYLNFLDPPITSVVQPMSEIARISIKILLEKIEQGEHDVMTHQEKILLMPRIIHRESIRAV